MNQSKFGVEPFKMNIFQIIPTFLLSKIMSRIFNTRWSETVMANHAFAAKREMEVLTSDFIHLAESNGIELKYLKEMMNENCT